MRSRSLPALAARGLLLTAVALAPAWAWQTSGKEPAPAPAKPPAAVSSSPHRRWAPWHIFGHGASAAPDPSTADSTQPKAVAAAAAPTPAVTVAPAAHNAPVAVALAHEYHMGVGDLVDVQVWHEPEISGKAPIRPDGKIAVPLAGELQAAGLTPRQLQAEIIARLRAYLSAPAVTVIVEQVNSRKFNVLGRVVRPGTYALVSNTRVLDALSLAGGLALFAHPSRIYVLRANAVGQVQKLKFNYKKVIRGQDEAEDILLQPGDTVVVP